MAREGPVERRGPARRQGVRAVRDQAGAGRPAAGALPGRVPEPGGVHQAAGRPGRDPADRHPGRASCPASRTSPARCRPTCSGSTSRSRRPPAPKPLGLVAGDPAGFPNGRRLLDDVVTIELRAVAGLTIPLVDPTFTPDGAAARGHRRDRRTPTPASPTTSRTSGRRPVATRACPARRRPEMHTHEEDNAHAGRGASVLLDIGGDVGAAVVAVPAALLGAEVEARAGRRRPPAGARRRGGPAAARRRPAAVGGARRAAGRHVRAVRPTGRPGPAAADRHRRRGRRGRLAGRAEPGGRSAVPPGRAVPSPRRVRWHAGRHDRRPARPAPGGAPELDDALLRAAAGDRRRLRPAAARRRRQGLPRLLRRHPHQHARLRRARGARRDRPGARPRGRAHLDALPDPRPGRAGRADRQAVRHRGREGVLLLLGHRGQRDGAAAGHPGPPLGPGAGAAQQLPRALVRGDGHHRHPRLVGLRAVPGPGLVRARRLPLPLAVPGPARRRVQRGLRRRPAGRDRVDHRRRRGLHDRRAGAGRRRVRGPAGRHARRDEADPRRVRDPADLRRGADRLGPHRRALLGHRGARRDAGHHDLRQGRRERAWPSAAWSPGPS